MNFEINNFFSSLQVSEVSQTMQELSKEMTKAGIIEEMLEDTMMSEDEVQRLLQLIITISCILLNWDWYN